MPRIIRLLLLLLLAGLGVMGYLRYQQVLRLNQLASHLELMRQEVADYNVAAEGISKQFLYGVSDKVKKNESQPCEAALLARANALRQQVKALSDTLHDYSRQLRRASQNPNVRIALTHPDSPGVVSDLLGRDTPAYGRFRQHLKAFTDTLYSLHPTKRQPLNLAFFNNISVVEALSLLTTLESDILAREARAYNYLSQRVGVPALPMRLVVAATAVTNVVAPGDTYRAKLVLLNTYASSTLEMTCNSHPIPVSADGVGQVRFRAPLRPGVASWKGTVRLNRNGRDTTFQTLVEYRVARR